jgi:RsiW-degrading membrane proteinase PrsW (M82 family)
MMMGLDTYWARPVEEVVASLLVGMTSSSFVLLLQF